ncbi:TetR/AcrR family transcriptional regulator [Pelagibacterium halotolerans]|uniref:TetR-family transcriptional regulator n=1 Tax=Pelagibacterium halotolerans (strain DSM 22347 / JCM 15775 / CGMCC 1.7692 / B2) TaxID=1082931 RepID=G4R6M1_PELHB|nr:TetR/AcrR family transcriptional regulator [Pelagibacterium halotolerans]AEQ51217.1 TetR-family transcriptional regulator [Pelagibacterium halotolerans B2]QJR18920.1 TetR/AcrR family transcriptional regulator [Pelagibacterium halotolerans]SEA68077.1 transcriptional regulator, TetR family [Pelagibacterium halotolerans]
MKKPGGSSAETTSITPRRGRGRRKHQPDADAQTISAATQADILKVAEEEFASLGFEGANIDEIARRTSTSKRMIYYYFENKRGLYKAVIKGAYASLRRAGAFENVNGLSPMEALRKYAESTFDTHLRHPNLVRLSLYENINRGEILGELREEIAGYPSNLEPLRNILSEGQKDGSIRSDLRLMDVYLIVVGISFHTISNAHSIKALFGHDMLSDIEIEARRVLVGDTVCRYATSLTEAAPTLDRGKA